VLVPVLLVKEEVDVAVVELDSEVLDSDVEVRVELVSEAVVRVELV